MKSLDTNIILRLLLADAPEQLAAIEKILSDPSQKFAVADMVFAEVVWVLQGPMYGYDRSRIAKNLEAIIGIQQINCNRKMLEKAIPNYIKIPKISFTDACLAAYAEIDNAKPLLTFDKSLARALPDSVQILQA